MSFEAEQTFRNLVFYYSAELSQINNGKTASTFFTYKQRKKLTKLGILQHNISEKRLKLTFKTKEMLTHINLHTII